MHRPPTVTRLGDGPIISPELHPEAGHNINGPSLIRAPDWLPNKMGAYYLYFADHKGDYIRLAYADSLAGPWTLHPGGTLQLADSYFPTAPPEAEPDTIEQVLSEYRKTLGDYDPPNGMLDDLTAPHIASPDIHVNHDQKRIEMYFHGLESVGRQPSRWASSGDGLQFVAEPSLFDASYLRAFRFQNTWYALAMPGTMLRRCDGPLDFETGPSIFPSTARHSAVRVVGSSIEVYWTRVGDAPERVLLSTIDGRLPWTQWSASEPVEVIRPRHDWEGAAHPVEPSQRSVAPGMVNQLRDPAIFVDTDSQSYLLYAVGGESGLAIARLD